MTSPKQMLLRERERKVPILVEALEAIKGLHPCEETARALLAQLEARRIVLMIKPVRRNLNNNYMPPRIDR